MESTVQPAITYGNRYVYKVDTTITLPTSYGEIVEGFTPWNGMDDISATNGQEIGIVEVDDENKAIAAGKTTVVAKQGGI